MAVILVAGATGLLGSRICRSLLSAGLSVRALAHREVADRLGVRWTSVEEFARSSVAALP